MKRVFDLFRRIASFCISLPQAYDDAFDFFPLPLGPTKVFYVKGGGNSHQRRIARIAQERAARHKLTAV